MSERLFTIGTHGMRLFFCGGDRGSPILHIRIVTIRISAQILLIWTHAVRPNNKSWYHDDSQAGRMTAVVFAIEESPHSTEQGAG